jgi:hypothetical protein
LARRFTGFGTTKQGLTIGRLQLVVERLLVAVADVESVRAKKAAWDLILSAQSLTSTR